ncbi:MAG: pyridoxal-phosphate dependent enzyme, partial [Bdellovibrionales bacterium]|nr:pyridoxal-phosphate dependent enzyme [Bdellovibrionales bacterium]
VSTHFANMLALFKQQPLSTQWSYGTIADGIAVKTPSHVMYENFIAKYVDDIVAVDDDEVAKAIVFLLERTKSVAEGAGAITLAAAALAKKNNWQLGKKTCVAICGGNIDMNMVAKVIEKGLTASGRTARLRITASDRPGQLQKITNVIAEHGGNILEVYHDRVGRGIRFSETVVLIVVETKGFDQVKEIQHSLQSLSLKVEID